MKNLKEEIENLEAAVMHLREADRLLGAPKPGWTAEGRVYRAKMRNGARVARAASRNWQKRTPNDDMIVEYVRQHEGERIENMGQGFGVPTSMLKRPVARLVRNGLLSKKGVRRGTTYFPGKKA